MVPSRTDIFISPVLIMERTDEMMLNQLTCERVFSLWKGSSDSPVPADRNVCRPSPWKRIVKTLQLLGLARDTWCVVRHVISAESTPPITTPALGFVQMKIEH